MVESGFERRASILLVPQLRARDIHPKAKPAGLHDGLGRVHPTRDRRLVQREKLQPEWLDDYTCCDSPWRTPQEFAVV